MKRIIAVVASLAVVACAGLFGSAGAADDPLTPEMKKQIDASLIVFVGAAKDEGTEEKAPDGNAKVRLVPYKIERYLKGSCFEPELTLAFPVAKTDDAKPTVGARVVVGAQLWPVGPVCVLRCKSEQFPPTAWTQQLEDAVLGHGAGAPRTATVPSTKTDRIDMRPPREKQQRLTCMNNLSQLGQVQLMHAQENRAKSEKYSGPALFLAMRKNAEDIRRGDERVLLCPADPAARPPETDEEKKRWDEVDLAKPAAGLCSYVGRDFAKFPVPLESEGKEPIGACLHHPGGAIVIFTGGDCQFLSLEDLGLASEAEKIVGPESKSPLLRKLK